MMILLSMTHQDSKKVKFDCFYDHDQHTWVCSKGPLPNKNVVVESSCASCPSLFHYMEICSKLKTWNVTLLK